MPGSECLTYAQLDALMDDHSLTKEARLAAQMVWSLQQDTPPGVDLVVRWSEFLGDLSWL